MTTLRFTVSVHEDEDGSLWAQVQEWPGCIASGRDLDELRAGITEAIAFYLANVGASDLEAVTAHEPASSDAPSLDDYRRRRSGTTRIRIEGLSLTREA